MNCVFNLVTYSTRRFSPPADTFRLFFDVVRPYASVMQPLTLIAEVKSSMSFVVLRLLPFCIILEPGVPGVCVFFF
jgi:hypothetical protein